MQSDPKRMCRVYFSLSFALHVLVESLTWVHATIIGGKDLGGVDGCAGAAWE